MKRIVCMILVCTFLFSQLFSFSVVADDDKEPQLVDKRFDVKLFGIVPFFPQQSFSSADILSVLIEENDDHPDELYVTLFVRDLSNAILQFDTGYTVSWWMNGIHYCLVVHRLPSGDISSFVAGYSDEYQDDIVEWNECDGLFNEAENLITWIIQKPLIGDPVPFSKLTSLSSTSFIRKIRENGFPGGDLFKDLTMNARSVTDYIIKF